MFAIAIPGLEPLGKAIAYALYWLASIAGGNYGVAIILLTVLMRIVLLPLSIKQTKSMIAMQKLQPQLKELQKKYKDDREKMGQEMMKLYKDNKVSPFGGCLPLILQLPIMFAVFEVLRSLASTSSPYFKILFPGQNPKTFNVATNPQLQFAGINITYTGAKLWSGGHYVQVIVLAVLTVATGYVSAKMMVTDPKQAKMMAMMPLLMGVFAWILPAGVTIYIIVTNIFTMVQQYVQLEHEGFYDEKLSEIRKLGEKASWHQRLYLRFMDMGTKALVAIRLRPRPKPPAKPKAAGTKTSGSKEVKKPSAKDSSSGNDSANGEQAKKKKQSPTSTKQSNGTAPPTSKSKKTTTKPAGKPPAKNYPAKKKSTGKK
jgi:YidC/Oxa1 family membrane protein insertase